MRVIRIWYWSMIFQEQIKIAILSKKKYSQCIDREQFIDWLSIHNTQVQAVLHLGARTDTTEKNWDIFVKLNLEYSKAIWRICAGQQIPLIYASSAATYGLGELGYEDNHNIITQLKPLNPYGDSKNEFDKWVILQGKKTAFLGGIKIFQCLWTK